MLVQTCQGAVCLGVAFLVSWPGWVCIFKAPDKTWIQFSELMWHYKKHEIWSVCALLHPH